MTKDIGAPPRARVRHGTDAHGQPLYDGLAAHFADRWGVISTVLAVPVLAFFSAGVAIGGIDGLIESFTDTIALGVIAGLVVGKVVGIAGATYLLTRLPGIASTEQSD